MKKILFISMCLLAFAFTENKANPYRPDRMFNYFYESLSPYGEWVEIDYDLYAWRPSYVRYNWSPYRDGRWIWTNQGWYWDSYEPYGWAVYHYGRWIYDDYYGWLWMPDNEWAPAWVEWRYDNNYIGWSPLPPYASFRINVGIHFSMTWNSPHVYWTFVDVHHFHGVHVSRYVVRDEVKYRIFSKTKYRTNYSYEAGRVINNGIDRKLVERRSGNKITQRDVNYTSETRSRDGGRSSNNSRSVSAYRPADTELARYEGRSEIKATRTDRKSSIQVDRVENNIYRERKTERNNASGSTRNAGSTGTTTRERTSSGNENSGAVRNAPAETTTRERTDNGSMKSVTVPQRTSGTERNNGNNTEIRNNDSEKSGNPARTGGTTGTTRSGNTERSGSGASGGSVEKSGTTQRSGSIESNSGTRSSRERVAEPKTSIPAQRSSTPQEVKKSTSGSETRGTTAGSGTRTQNPSKSGSSENSATKTRGNNGRSGRQ